MGKVARKLSRRTVEAEENAVIDFQFTLIDLLKDLGITKDELATKLGVSKSRVSQLFAAGANPTLKQVARVLEALDYRPTIGAVSIEADERKTCVDTEVSSPKWPNVIMVYSEERWEQRSHVSTHRLLERVA